jgi:predicted RNA-binding protein with PIN domain
VATARTEAPDSLLRAALQLALDVARIGAASVPPVEAPRPLRPFLHFTRMPDQALTAVRKALDEDEPFRSRVAVLADEGELGRAGWLFVVRPEGWEDELAGLAQAAQAQADSEQEAREERSARRRLAHAEAALQRAESASERARTEVAKATADLATERRERRAAQEEAAQLSRRVTSLEGERDSARRKADAAAEEAARRSAETERLAAEVRALEARLEAAETEAIRVTAVPPAEPAGSGSLPPDAVAAVARAVGDAARAAGALSSALAGASAALQPPEPAGPGAAPAAAAPARAPSPPRPREAVDRPPARHPATLPPAVLDDSVEAAAHLVRVPGMLVLVDGYNAAKALWPAVPPIELRERLVDALSELHARTGAGIHVIFDGADLGGARPRPRSGVRVSFSPADVEADDVILGLVDQEPVRRPVVVASSDRRVQDGARLRGASVVSTAQLAGVLGRA